MDDWKHLSGINNPIYLQVGRIKVLSFLDGLFVVVAFSEALVVGFIEAVDFVFHIFS